MRLLAASARQITPQRSFCGHIRKTTQTPQEHQTGTDGLGHLTLPTLPSMAEPGLRLACHRLVTTMNGAQERFSGRACPLFFPGVSARCAWSMPQ
jgi:hypothetical protein